MKLKAFDRVVAVLLVLLMMAGSVFAVVLPWGQNLISPAGFTSWLYDILSVGAINKIIITVVAVVLLLLGVRLLFVRQGGSPAGRDLAASSVLIKAGEHGSSYITRAALEFLVQKRVRAFDKVRDCQSAVLPSPEDMCIQLKISAMPDVDFPEITQELQADISAYMEGCTGIRVREVQVLITAPETPQVSSQKLRVE